MDTRGILFICGGAFVGLTDIVRIDGRDHDCNGSTHSDRSSDAGNQFFLHRITPVSEDRVEMTDDKDTIPEKGNQ